MSRRANAKPAGVQMFPFLAVLICTMGALVVLLHAFARHGQLQAIKIAEAKAPGPVFDMEDFQWRMKHIRTARDKTGAELADERLKLAHVEDHARRLREKLEQAERAAAQIEAASAAQDDETQGRAAELKAAKAELDRARAALDAARRKGGTGGVNYSVVPYDGLHATQRRPIYIECRADLIVLQPEGIELTPHDFAGYFGPSNPLAAAVRAQREYFARQETDGELADEPYPLLLVRPEGVMTYNAARRALVSWGTDFGYELIGADWELKFRDPDPELAKLTQKIVGEARLRHRQYTLTTPHVTRQRSRPVYRARAHGGFAPEGGGSYPRQGADSPWDGYGGGWEGGGNSGTGDDPYATPESHDFLSSGGRPTSRDPYGSAGSRGLRSSAGGPTRPDASGSGGDRDALSAGGDATAGNRATDRGMADRGEGRSPGDGAQPTDRYGNADADGQGGAGLATGNPRPTDIPGMPGGRNIDAQASNGGNPATSTDGQHSRSCPTCNSPSGTPRENSPVSVSPPHGSTTRKPQSIAATRGHDWGLPASAGRSVAATRPIRVLCYPDRLVIVPESQGQRPTEIPLQAQTRDSMDELVSGVWEHMKSWGKAGRKLYWRPLLSIDVQGGAVDRYAEIQALLADSGIDVERRQPRRAPRNGNRTTRSRPVRP